MKFLYRPFCLLIALLLSGCQQAGFAVVNLPNNFHDIRVTKDISYGADALQNLDVYAPKAIDENSKLPVIVFFHGGRWSSGIKDDYAFVANAFTKRGFVVVVPNYRKYPQVRFPAFVEDGAHAISWVYDHIDQYNGDPQRIFVVGHSSGAHVGALLTADRHYLKDAGKEKQIIRGFAGLAGPYNFTPDEPDLIDMFGPPANYPKMQVTTFITGHEPPMLLLWGDADKTVERYNLDRLAGKIKAKNGTVETEIYPGVNHIGIITALSWINKKDQVANDITKFFGTINNAN